MNIHHIWEHEDYLTTLPKKYLNLIKTALKCTGCKCKVANCKHKHKTDGLYKCIGCGLKDWECW